MPDQADELRKIMAAQRGEQKHAPEEDDDQKMVEPLSIGEYSQWISDADGRIIAYDEGTLGIGIGDDRTKSRARRIVACVNSLKGIQTEYLESHGLDDVGETVQSLDTAIRERDEARAMVAELVNELKKCEWDGTGVGGEADSSCPWCHEHKNHDKDCGFIKIIAKAQALLA